MKALVVYDSKYGHTKMVAEAIADALGEAFPGEVVLKHATEAAVPSRDDADLLIVGAPTHGGRPSPDAHAYLERVEAQALDGIHVAGFDTRTPHFIAKIFGYAAPRIVERLEKAGGRPAGAPGDFYVKGTQGPLLEGELERAAAWAEGLVKPAAG